MNLMVIGLDFSNYKNNEHNTKTFLLRKSFKNGTISPLDKLLRFTFFLDSNKAWEYPRKHPIIVITHLFKVDNKKYNRIE